MQTQAMGSSRRICAGQTHPGYNERDNETVLARKRQRYSSNLLASPAFHRPLRTGAPGAWRRGGVEPNLTGRQIWPIAKFGGGLYFLEGGSTSAKILDAPGPILEFPGIKNGGKKNNKSKSTKIVEFRQTSQDISGSQIEEPIGPGLTSKFLQKWQTDF